MWVDEVSLLETDMPHISELFPDDQGYQDEPKAAVLDDGKIALRWSTYTCRDGEQTTTWANAEPTRDGLRLCDITTGIAPELFESLVQPAREVTGRQIVAGRPYAYGETGVGASISPPEFRCYNPSLAVRPNGEVCVAYHSFRDGNYDIYMRALPPGAAGGTSDEWTPERRLTTAPTIDRHAELIPHGDDLYLVYENATCRDYKIGSTYKRHLIVTRVDDDGLKTVRAKSPLSGQSEAACLAIDAHDRLWIAYRKIRGRHQGWATWLTALDLKTGQWTRPLPVTTKKGPDRKPAMAVSGGRAYVISVCNDFPNRYPDEEASLQSTSQLYIATVDLPDVDPDRETTIEWMPLIENDEPFPPAEIRVARGEDLPQQSTEYNGETFHLYFGDLHEHSDISICNQEGDGSLDESYQHMRDFVHIPHQLADTGNVPCDHSFHDEEAQPVAEIFQTRGSYEYYGAPRMAGRTTGEPGQFYQDMLADGLIIGVIAAPDHGGGYGKAAVWAKDLTREAILDALRARRCYGTTAAKIVLDVRVNGHMMGENVASTPEGPVDVAIRVMAPREIREVALCRNGEFIRKVAPDGKSARLTLTDEEPLCKTSYYYVRVILDDDEIAWCSPVWFGRE